MSYYTSPNCNEDLSEVDEESYYVDVGALAYDKIINMTTDDDEIKKFLEVVVDVAVSRGIEINDFLVEEWDEVKYKQRYVDHRLELLNNLKLWTVSLLIRQNYKLQNVKMTLKNSFEVEIGFDEYELILECADNWIYYLHKRNMYNQKYK